MRRAFGLRFHYIERDLDPFESFAVIGDLDLLVTDTFHGAIAAIIQDVPFISVDVEPEITSRKEQLLSTLGSPELNVRLRRGEPGMEELLVRGVGKFVATPSRVDVSRLAAARASWHARGWGRPASVGREWRCLF